MVSEWGTFVRFKPTDSVEDIVSALLGMFGQDKAIGIARRMIDSIEARVGRQEQERKEYLRRRQRESKVKMKLQSLLVDRRTAANGASVFKLQTLAAVRVTAVSVAVLTVLGPDADAQFRPGVKNLPLPTDIFLECGIVQTTEGYKKDEDPIYKISISLALDDNRNPTGLTVTHVSANGKSYVRDEQYTDANLTHTPGKTKYFWTGKMAKNTSYTMKGTLVRTVDNKWYYMEQQFRNGKQSSALKSACHVVEGE